MPKVVEEGVWCPACQFFEQPDFGTRCRSCGCPESEHVKAKVVVEDD